MTALAQKLICHPRFGTSSVLAGITYRLNVRAQRRALSRLTPAQLSDIGLSVEQAEAEARRHMFDVPCV